MDVFFEQAGIPTNSCLLLDTLEEAAGFPTGDLRLGFCPACGFISNVVFEEAEYSSRYEETQGFSKLFVEWAQRPGPPLGRASTTWRAARCWRSAAARASS